MPPFITMFDRIDDLTYRISANWGGDYGKLIKDGTEWICNFGSLDIDASLCREVADKLDELNKK